MICRQKAYILLAALCQIAIACEPVSSGVGGSPTTGSPGNNGNTTLTGGNTTVAIPANVTFYKDVKAIAVAKCATCHATGGIGPFTLTEFADWNTKMAAIASDVSANLMPPWMPDDGCATYNDDLSLSAEEKAIIDQWVKLNGPAGDPNDYVAPAASAAPAFRTDMTLTMTQQFQVQTSPDQYRCFLLPWNSTTTKYVTGFGIRPGNASIVHHAIVDIVAASDAASIHSKDGADGSPGWDCGQQGESLNWLALWAPGGTARTFGVGDTVGTRLNPNDMLVIQVHYHVVGNPNSASVDRSSVDLELADTVQKEGHFIQVLNPTWVAGNMPIAANQNDVIHDYTVSPSLAYLAITQSLPPSNMAVYAVAGHMHYRGSIFNMSITRNNQQQCLLAIPNWNFNWQNGYQLTTPFNLQSGDKVNVDCHWDNTAAHQPVVNGQREIPKALNWGEGTEDEMCIGFLYMAPQ